MLMQGNFFGVRCGCRLIHAERILDQPLDLHSLELMILHLNREFSQLKQQKIGDRAGVVENGRVTLGSP